MYFKSSIKKINIEGPGKAIEEGENLVFEMRWFTMWFDVQMERGETSIIR